MPAQPAMQGDSKKRILFGYYAAITLLFVSFLLTFYANSQLKSYAVGVERTNIIVRHLQGLFAEIRNAESSFQGFLIIQDSDFLDPYKTSHFRADSILRELNHALEPDHRERHRLDTISVLLERRYSLFEDGLQLFYRFAGSDSIVEKIRKGKITTDQLHLQLEAIEKTEKSFLQERSDKLEMYSKAILPVNLFTLLLAILLAAYSVMTYNHEQKAAFVANKARFEKEDQLKQKVEELKKANEDLIRFRRMEKFAATGRIARILAHEVRNPLSNINLAVGQLKDEPFATEENSAMLIDMITRNSERINQLINELLYASRIQEMSFFPVSVNALLDEALEMATDRAELQHIRVIKEYSKGMHDIRADREKLKIAFLNIIVNAIEAMAAGKGILTLRTESRNGKCVVTISDNGSGIDPESLPKLFEPYFTTKPKGSGFGLANTQAIILTHEGSIEVESEPGKGTAFIVTLNFTS